MKSPLQKLLPWLTCSAALLLANHAAAQATLAAGTLIPNTATASYIPPNATTPVTSTTNTVSTSVAGMCHTAVTATTTPSATLLPGETGTFGFVVSNMGNEQSTIVLSPAMTGSVGALQVYSDTNGNGQLDSGEPEISQVTLAAGAKQKVVVAASTTQSSSAGTYSVTLSGSCGNGESATATSSLSVGEAPNLTVNKTFTPAQIKPGEETTVKVVLQNSGGASREIILTDPLLVERQSGLVVVPGSVTVNNSSAVIEYTQDSQTWQTTAPDASTLEGIRARASSLSAGGLLELTFKMKAEDNTDGRNFINVASATTGTESQSSSAVLTVKYNPGVAIGPVGNPLAPEGTPADSQTVGFAVVGSQVCFTHTVQNTGDVADVFSFSSSVSSTVLDASGQPLTQPITLKPGETANMQVCYIPSAAGNMDSVVTVTGARGTTNTTHDLLPRIELGLPELKKVSNASATDPLSTGSVVTYTLSAHNPYSSPLTNVTFSDSLPAHTDFVSADNGGVNSSGVVSWNIGTLAPGETRLVTVSAKVNDQAQDGEQISNTFHLASKEITKPIDSNPVENVVWNAQIRIDKAVNNRIASPGDALTYTLVIHNDSAQASLHNAVVTDTPAAGLAYMPGTATLEGQPIADPTIAGGNMSWSIGDLLPSKNVTVTYKMRVTPTVSGDLINTVQVEGYAGDAAHATRKIASNRATALVRPRLLNFAPLNDIVGLVFVDRNRNGVFDKNIDTPVERARVILAGGRLALTDKDGRYHFANVALGTQALRLDPITTTYDPLNTPQTQGLSGTQTVFVRGLTSVDFPLAPIGGDISAIRRTSLTMGDLHLDKAVYHTDQGYGVALKLNTSKALEQFSLTDPLPTGATLQEGSNIWKGTLPVGETILNYRFNFVGGDEAAVTDPNVVWRY